MNYLFELTSCATSLESAAVSKFPPGEFLLSGLTGSLVSSPEQFQHCPRNGEQQKPEQLPLCIAWEGVQAASKTS